MRHDAHTAQTPIQTLARFRDAKQLEIAELERLEGQGLLPLPAASRPSFTQALLCPGRRNNGLPAVVAEYKRASPSRGDIAPALLPEDVARQYAEAGAACISVLTEEAHFKGSLAHLERTAGAGLPLLRKDFLFHPLQIARTAATPASALLLIVRLTPDVRLLRDLREEAERFGLEAVVEVFDATDLKIARDAGAALIQVNARNLESFAVDRNACLRLAETFRHQSARAEGGGERGGEVWIAASGMERREHLRAAAEAGFDAALIGTALMEGGEPGRALRALLPPNAAGAGL